MYRIFESEMQGGVCMISKRYAKANHNLLGNVKLDLPESWIIYKDLNNLYGWQMSQLLAFGQFNWVDEDTFNQID